MDKHQNYEVACRRLGWSFKAFVVDVFGGLGQEARDFLTILLKGLLGQREGWQRRGLEATIWQEVYFTIMKEIGRQLVWSVLGEEGEEEAPDASTTHSPYA